MSLNTPIDVLRLLVILNASLVILNEVKDPYRGIAVSSLKEILRFTQDDCKRFVFPPPIAYVYQV